MNSKKIKVNNMVEEKLSRLPHSVALQYALKITRNINKVEDLVSETYLRCLEKQDSYTEESYFNAWFYRVMQNIYIDNMRLLKNKLLANDDENSFDHFHVEQEDLDHIDILDRIKKYNNKDIKHELLMMFIEGWSYAELGKKFKITPELVKYYIYKERTAIKKFYPEFGYLENNV